MRTTSAGSYPSWGVSSNRPSPRLGQGMLPSGGDAFVRRDSTEPAPVRFGWWRRRKPNPVNALNAAVAANDQAVVQKALDSGADINGRDDSGMTPLYTAALEGHVDMLHFLLDRNANPDQRGYQARTVLMELLGDSVRGPNPAYARSIKVLAGVTNVNIRDANGWTAINLACRNGFDDAVDDLLANGADVTVATEKDKMTPLMYAAWRGKDALALKLIQSVPPERRKAYINARNIYKRSAFDIAVSNCRKEVIALLRTLGAEEKRS